MKTPRPYLAAFLAPALLLALALAGCAKQPSTLEASAPPPGGPGDAPPRAAEQPGPAPAQAPGGPRGAMARPAPSGYTAIPDLTDIHFDFDKYEIRPDDAKILDADAAWLTSHSDQLILVEGHCDERGTSEYNLALGERRARATLNYLVSRGVKQSRLTIVSYGEERPVCREHGEECWAKNRRAHFLAKRG
jgi:peptidoglycan-associated lipoprotein